MPSNAINTFWVKIYIAGPIEVAKQIIRRECKREGLCVTIDPTDYIYTGGEEAGYVVQLINYPKFPKADEDIFDRALNLANDLMDETYQESFLLMTPLETFWYSERE